MLRASTHEITTQLRVKSGEGDAGALAELRPLVYPQLRSAWRGHTSAGSCCAVVSQLIRREES